MKEARISRLDDQIPGTAPAETSRAPGVGEYDVFISYSRRDVAFVRGLAAELEGRERTAWVDWDDIAPTVEWREEIARGIASAHAFVFVMSPDSLISVECGKELELAVAQSKRIIPLLLREADGAPIPPRLADLNWIYFTGGDSERAQAMDTLVTELDADHDWARAHTRLTVRADEWQRHEQNRSYLLSGRDLREAEDWLAGGSVGKTPEVTELQRAFVLAGRRVSNRRGRLLLAGVSLALVVAVALSIVALIQRSHAIAEQKQATSRGLANASVALLAVNPALSTLLAERAVDTRLTPVADEALRRALGGDQMRRRLRVSGPAEQAIFSPDGSLFAAEAGDTVSVWRTADARLLTVMRAKGRIEDLTFSPGSDRVAAGSTDGVARVWQVPSGRLVATMHEPGGAHVGRVAFNGGGNGLLTGSADGTVRLWNAATGAAAALIYGSPPVRGRPDRVLTMGISPNSSYVVSGTQSGVVTLARTVSGRIVSRRLRGQSGLIIALSFSADGRRFATTSGDGTAAVRRADGSLLALIRGAPAGMPIFDATLSPDGKLLVITGLGTSALWNVDPRQRLAVLAGPAGSVQTARFSPDGHFFVTGGSDGVARVWQGTGNDLIAPGQLVTTLAGHGGPVNDAEFSPDGEQVLTAGSDATVRVWQAAPGRSLLRYQGPVTGGLALSPDGQMLAVPDPARRMLALRRVGPGALVRTLNVQASLPAPAQPVSILDSAARSAFSPDGRLLAYFAAGPVLVKDVATGGSRVSLKLAVPDRQFPYMMAFSPDGRRLAVGYMGTAPSDDLARVWDLASGSLMAVMRGHSGGIGMVAFSPDGRTLLTGAKDGTVRLWNAATGAQLHVLPVPAPQGYPVAAFSPEGTRIVTAALGSRPTVWSTSGRQLLTIGADHEVSAVAFSPYGHRLLIGYAGGVAVLADAGTGATALTMRGHSGAIADARFSPDGRVVLTASLDGTARVWNAATGVQLAELGGFTDGLSLATFSGHGLEILATGFKFSRVYACDVCGSVARLKRVARQLVPFGLTPLQRRTYLVSGT